MTKVSKTYKLKNKKSNSFVDKFVPCAVFIGVVLALDYVAIWYLFNRTDAQVTVFLSGAAAVLIGAVQFHSVKKVVSKFK